MPSDEYEKVKDRALQQIGLVCEWLMPGGKREGGRYVGAKKKNGGPGDSVKVVLETGKYVNYSTGQYGDMIQLCADLKQIENRKAMELVREFVNERGDIPVDSAYKKEKKIVPAEPPPGKVPNFYCKLTKAKPSKIWKYRSEGGTFFLARYENSEPKTMFWVWSSSHDSFKGGMNTGKCYPLHHEKLASVKRVIVCEGEKTAEAANKIINGRDVFATTFPGGANGIENGYLEPLRGKDVLLWPDNDNVSNAGLSKLADRLASIADSVRMVDYSKWSEELPKKWDVADAKGWDWNKFCAFIRQTSITINIGQVNINVQSTDHKSELATGTMGQKAWWAQIGINLTEKGVPPCNQDTGAFVIRASEYASQIWFDEFHQKTFFKGRPVRDRDYREFLEFCQGKKVNLRNFRKPTAIDSINRYAEKNPKNEVLDWIGGIEWDKAPRLETFMYQIFGCEDNPYTRAVSKNFWISMMARVSAPGCFVDNMVVLEGDQGVGKSKALRYIGKEWYKSVSVQVGYNSVEFLKSIKGAIVVEIPELAAFTRADHNVLKSLISTEIDEFRQSYGVESESHPRQCIFVGTTNDDDYVRDPTGARRYWPIEVTKAEWGLIESVREQCFAEALHRYEMGESWWEVPGEAKEIQALRFRADPWEEIIRNKAGIREEITESQVMQEFLELQPKEMGPAASHRIPRILRRLGYEPFVSEGGKVWQKTF